MKSKSVFLIVVLGFLIPFHVATAQNTKVELPTKFKANRVFVTPVTASGDTLRFYTDSGGGTNIIWPSTVQRLGLATRKHPMPPDTTATVATLPPFKQTASIPHPPASTALGTTLVVSPGPWWLIEGSDGFLGSPWFSTRTWEFDYPGESLSLLRNYDTANHLDEHTVTLGFQTNPNGEKTMYFPRITISVDGDSIDMLFDTGATLIPQRHTAEALGKNDTSPIGASFIADSIFQEWKSEHPDWTVIQNAEQQTGLPIIKVPEIGIAGYEVGPVWFTKRPNRNFVRRMSRWIDKTIYGAVGSSAFQYFRIIIDYPEEKAVFYRE